MKLSRRAERALGKDAALFSSILDIARGGLQVVKESLRHSGADDIVQDENAAAAGASKSADIAVEQWVARNCAKIGTSVLSEESGEMRVADASHFLILDPIDGTAMALRGLPLYGVALAVGRLQEGRIFLKNLIFGIVTSPMGEYYGIRNGGAYAGDSTMKTSDVRALRDAMARFPQRPEPPLPFEAEDFIYLGCTALELCWLAQGAVDVYVESKPRKVFDFAAGMLIVEEAGGVVTTLTGKSVLPTEINARSRSTLLVTANGALARELKDRR